MNVVLPVKSLRFHAFFKNMLKAVCIIAICLITTSSASAQHCQDCNVNIFGDEFARVGETRTYYVTPRYPDVSYTPIWDYSGNLSPYATIIDQGRNAWGNEYITLYFHTSGYTWLSYDGLYDGMTQDYDEMTLHIMP
jgi:hypothetical protein